MNTHDASELEIEEPLTIRVEEPVSTNKYTFRSLFRRIFTLDDVTNKEHHRPVFTIFMSIFHIFLYFLTYIRNNRNSPNVVFRLYNLSTFFLPCMQPTGHTTRIDIVTCPRSMNNRTCHYDDILRNMCSSFAYPHQLWRMITVNFFHFAWLHLLSNLLVQIVQGIPLERKYGSVRVAVVYWLSGLAASLSFAMAKNREPGTGASGSLYGLMLFLVVDRLVAMQTNIGRRRFIAIQLALLLLPHIIASIPLIVKYNVAHSAHFGGGLVGFLIGVGIIGFPWPWNNEFCISQTTCQRIAFVFLALYYIIMFFVFFLADAPIIYAIFNGEPWFSFAYN